MAKQGTTKAVNTFIKGIITEAAALTYPENASIDEENFILSKDGSRQRRLGMDFEALHSLIETGAGDITFENYSISTFIWESVDNQSHITLGVVQVGPVLYFVDLTANTLSANLANSGRPLTVGTVGQNVYQYASIDGRLIVSTDEKDPLYIEHIVDEDSFIIGTIDIKIRDLIGVADNLRTEDTPPALTTTHKYNLFNQGWDNDRIDAYRTESGGYPSNAQIWHSARDTNDDFDPELLDKVDFGTSPAAKGRFIIDAFDRGASRRTVSNISGVTSTVTGQYRDRDGSVSGSTTVDLGVSDAEDIVPYINEVKADASEYSIVTTGSTTTVVFDTPEPPLNRIGGGVKDEYFILRNYKVTFVTLGADITVLPNDKELGHISTVTAHAGRVFYSGITSKITGRDSKSPSYTGWVFFSRTVQEREHLAQCYQEADPSAEEISDLIDTDGGTINVAGAANITKLVSIGDILLVLAENGIWEVSGTDKGFLATDYSVNKVSGIGVINALSIVSVENNVYYWSEGGIYLLSPDDITGRYSPTNITETTIQSLINDISGIAKENVTGIYDTASKRVSWLYNDASDYNGVTDRHEYNKELILDTVLGAFYKNSISESTPYIAGYMPTPNFLVIDDIQPVVTEVTCPVLVNGEDVTITSQVRSRGFSTIKYMTVIPNTDYEFTFSHYRDDTFTDWKTYDDVGVDYSSFLLTGHELYGDIMRDKEVPYLMFYFQRTETGFEGEGLQLDLVNPSSCFVQARWEWTDSINSGRWGTPFQAYRLKRNYIPDSVIDPFDYGFEVVVTKSKLRGHGKSLSLNIQSETNKDMHLLGWASSVSGGTSV